MAQDSDVTATFDKDTPVEEDERLAFSFYDIYKAYPRAVRDAAEAEAEVVAVEKADLAQAHATLEEKSDAEILAELDLPDPDALEKGDDFSVFLEKPYGNAPQNHFPRICFALDVPFMSSAQPKMN